MSSLSLESGISFPSFDKALLKQEATKRSAQIIAIVTKEKFGQAGGFFAGDVSALDIIVTDEQDAEILKPYLDEGVKIMTLNDDTILPVL